MEQAARTQEEILADYNAMNHAIFSRGITYAPMRLGENPENLYLRHREMAIKAGMPEPRKISD